MVLGGTKLVGDRCHSQFRSFRLRTFAHRNTATRATEATGTEVSSTICDETPVTVLALGMGKTKTGGLWTYVRDDRSPGDTAPPPVWFAYSPVRKGEHPQQHLREFRGTLQADSYARFNQLYEDGRIREAACWAHVRRKFYDLTLAQHSPIAAEAVERIAVLYAIESEIRGRPPEERKQVRQARARPLVESLRPSGVVLGKAIAKVREGLASGVWECLLYRPELCWA